MPKTNQEIITLFYQAFARHDTETMASLYHDDIEFTDPAFGTLKGEEARNMWRMLIERAKGGLVVKFSDVAASETSGSARWTADYLFSTTGRQVHNEITAKFVFHEGKIIRHADSFSFWTWSRQALGLPGLLLGWTPFLKNKVRTQARRGLTRFSDKKE